MKFLDLKRYSLHSLFSLISKFLTHNLRHLMSFGPLPLELLYTPWIHNGMLYWYRFKLNIEKFYIFISKMLGNNSKKILDKWAIKKELVCFIFWLFSNFKIIKKSVFWHKIIYLFLWLTSFTKSWVTFINSGYQKFIFSFLGIDINIIQITFS